MVISPRFLTLIFLFVTCSVSSALPQSWGARVAADTNRYQAVLAKAVSQRSDYLERYHAFRSETFQRCEAYLHQVPFELWPVSGISIPTARDTGLLYWSEDYHHTTFTNYYRHQLQVIAKREGGKLPVYNWNYAPSYNFNILQERVIVQDLFERGFVSPLSYRNRSYYRFSGGKIEHNAAGQKLVWVHFRPSRSGVPAMRGKMALEEESGLPLEVHFTLTADNQLEQLDSITVSQKFVLDSAGYRQQQQEIAYYLNLFGFAASYHLFQQHLKFSYLQNSDSLDFPYLVFQLDSGAFQRDEILTTARAAAQKEGMPFAEKYPLPLRDRRYPRHRFRLNARLHQEPYSLWRNSYRSYELLAHSPWYIDLPSIYKGLGYNAVEGAYLRHQAFVGYQWKRSELSLRSQLRYGTADATLKPSASLSFLWGKRYRQELELTGGRDYRQINEKEPISPLLNTSFMLLMGENYMSLFDVEFLKIAYRNDLTNGIKFSLSGEWSQRSPLFNQTRWSIFNAESDFIANNPGRGSVIDPQSGFSPHRALVVEGKFSYQFSAQYAQRYRQNMKDVYRGIQALDIRAPGLYYEMKAGLPNAISQTDFFFHKLGYHHRFRLGNAGISQVDISAGSFARSKSVPFIDYHHFDGTQILFLNGAEDPSRFIRQFSTLPYYAFSTTQDYLELHYEHVFSGALLSDVGLLRRNKVHAFTGFNSLHIRGQASFVEIFFGFSNIFKVMRLEIAGGIDQFWKLRPALRLGFDFDYDYYRLHRNFR